MDFKDDLENRNEHSHLKSPWITGALSLLGLPLLVAGVALLSSEYGNARSKIHLPNKCYAPSSVDCDFYPSCLEERFQCGPEGYPIDYGQKYCERFMTLNTPYSISSSKLSEEGIQWRNATLICLQKDLVAPLRKGPENLSCDELQTLAFDSHPGCYTQPGQSICALPISDWRVIASVVDFGDYATFNSLRQVKEVLLTCATSLHFEFQGVRNELISSRLTKKHGTEAEVQSHQVRAIELQSRAASLQEKIDFLEDLRSELSHTGEDL